MSYNDNKIIVGQEIVEFVELLVKGCKYATTGKLAARTMVTSVGDSLHATATGDVFTLTTGTATNFISPSYMRMPSGEILKVTITDATHVTVTERGLFGTAKAAGSGVMTCRMMHQGEADGTCFGYAQTCSSSDSYDASTTRELKFSYAPLDVGAVYTNGLIRSSISRDGPEVHPGRDIGTRARLSFQLLDEEDPDDQLNPYRDRIATNGTKLGKLFARNPYFDGNICQFREGLRTAGLFTITNMITRTYTVDKVELDNGKASFSCLDPLILTEDKKSKTPPQSLGKLTAAITGTPATFTYTGADDYHYGANATTTYVRVDSEIIKCTVTGVKTLTVVTRGYKSVSKDHASAALIQVCEVFLNTHIVDVITTILEDRCGVAATHIDDYSALIAATPSSTITEAILSKPTASVERINELIRLADLIFYFDEITSKIVIDYLPELSIEPVSLNDDEHFKKESISISRNADKQRTRFSYAWAPYDLTKDSDEFFQFYHTVVNATLEGGRNIGQANEMPLEKSSFLIDDTDDSILAVAYVSRTIERNALLPSILTATIDASNEGDTQGGTIAPGKIISVSTYQDQNIYGDQIGSLYQIEKISGTIARGFTLKARRYVSIEPDNVDFVIDTSASDYNLATHYAPAAGAYIVYISPGVVLGSTSTANAAFTTGSQAGGVSFHIINRGQILGMGGVGGAGGSALASPTGTGGYKVGDGSTGLVGGHAFNATVNCTIDTGSGLIWGGGGGQGGQAGAYTYDASGPGLTIIGAKGGDGGNAGRGATTSAQAAFGTAGNSYKIIDGALGAVGGPASASTGGGYWGADGDVSILNPVLPSYTTRAAGGAAGKAIAKNGNTVTITAGNNSTNVKGLVS